MKRIVLACCAAVIASCGGDDAPEVLDCGNEGDQVTVSGEEFCVYAGFLPDQLVCPPLLPTAVEFPTGTVCTERSDLAVDATPGEVCTALGTQTVDPLECSATVSCLRGTTCCEGMLSTGCVATEMSCDATCAQNSVFCGVPCEQECEPGTIPCATGCCDGTIRLDIVDANATANEGSESAIGADAAGTAHIIFKRSGELVHAHNRSGSFTTTVIDAGGDPTDVLAVVEPNGMIHATYVIGTSPRYARYNGCSWTTEELPQPAIDLALDLTGGPLVLVGREVLERTDDGWTRFGNILPDGRDGVSLAVDAFGQLHATAFEIRQLQYLVLDDDGWDVSVLTGDVPFRDGRYEVDVASCIFDTSNPDEPFRNAIYATVTGCLGTDAQSLCVYDRASGNFATRPFSRSVLDHRMAVASDGTVHLVLVREPDLGDSRTAVTEYARWDGNAWQFFEIVGSDQAVGRGISIALGLDNAVHIALFEDGLRYVRIDP